MIAATLWAAFSRLYHLAALPPQAWVDEAWYNLRARDLLLTGEFQVFYRTFWGGMHPLVVHLTAVVQALGIRSLVASRGVAAASGLLTIPLAFAAFDELWRREAWPAARRRWIAALAALILSNLLYMVVASRIGYGPALIPPVMLVYVWQTRRAQRMGSADLGKAGLGRAGLGKPALLSWGAAGLALGLAQYINLNGRFLIPLVVALALHDLWLSRRASGRRRSVFLGLAFTAAVSLAVALPLIIFFLREPQWLLARAHHVTVGARQSGLETLLDNAWRIALSFNFVGDFNPRQNLPGRPMFDWIQSAGLGAGGLWAIRNFRRSATARELPAWVMLMTVSSLVTDDAPQFERMIGAGVPAAALVAIGWVHGMGRLLPHGMGMPLLHGIGMPLLHSMGRLLPWVRREWLLRLGAVLLLISSLALNAYDYFVRYPRAPGLAEAFTHTPVRLARTLIERAQTEAVFVERITEAEDVYAFDFLFPGTPVRRLDFRQCMPLADGRATRTTYLVLAERDPQSVGSLARAFPSATITRIKPEGASLMGQAVLVEAPPGATWHEDAIATVSARFAPGIKLLGYWWSGPKVKAGESLFLTVYWKAEADFSTDFTTFLHVLPRQWHGDAIATPLIAQRDGQPCQGFYPTSQWRAGDVIPDGFAITFPSNTPPGDYPLAVGWYSYPSLERLTLTEADQPLPDNRAVIGTLTISAP